MKPRLCQTQDHAALKKLISAIYTDFKSAGDEALFNWTEDKTTSLFPNFKFVVLADKTGELLGFICFQELGDDFEIIALGVDPKYQRRGYMRQIFDFFVENICSKSGRILLEVHERNRPAILFYEKSGFIVDGLRRNYYKDGSSAVNMSRAQGRNSATI